MRAGFDFYKIQYAIFGPTDFIKGKIFQNYNFSIKNPLSDPHRKFHENQILLRNEPIVQCKPLEDFYPPFNQKDY